MTVQGKLVEGKYPRPKRKEPEPGRRSSHSEREDNGALKIGRSFMTEAEVKALAGVSWAIGAGPSLLDRISVFTKKGSNVLAVLAQILEGALQSLPALLANMGAVLVAAIASVVAVSFFRGETTIFTNGYQLIIFITGTLSPILGLIGGIAIVIRAQRRREWDQRELGVLFTLVFFAIAYYYGLVGIPQITVVS